LRVADAREIPIENPFDKEKESAHWQTFDDAATLVKMAYNRLTEEDAPKEDARGILPLNTTCTLVAKYNLRTLSEVIVQRSSLRAQGPYAQLAAEIKRLVLEAVPEFECFFDDPKEEAYRMLESVAKELGVTPGKGPAWEIAKAIDLLRKEG
jgi:thymidylate synthase ThyX